MPITKLIAISGSSSLFLITGLSGSYFATKETIYQASGGVSKKGGEEKINNETIWKKLATSFKDKHSKSGIKTQELKRKKDEIEKDTEGNELKKWCTISYKSIYKSVFNSPNEELKEDVSNYCKYEIKQVLTDSKIFKDTDKEDSKLKERFKSLQKSKTTNNYKLTPALRAVTTEEELLKECQEIYKKGYRGEENNDWLLAEAFCKKE